MAALMTYKGFSCSMCPAFIEQSSHTNGLCTFNAPPTSVSYAAWPIVKHEEKCWKGYELSKKAPQ